MKDIVISIRPEFVDAILAGTKTYEYRRRLPLEKPERLIVYETAPVSKVVAVVQVEELCRMPQTKLWHKTKKWSGLDGESFRRYFKGQEDACAFKLGTVSRLAEPVGIERFGLSRPPQSWCYLKTELPEEVLVSLDDGNGR